MPLTHNTHPYTYVTHVAQHCHKTKMIAGVCQPLQSLHWLCDVQLQGSSSRVTQLTVGLPWPELGSWQSTAQVNSHRDIAITYLHTGLWCLDCQFKANTSLVTGLLNSGNNNEKNRNQKKDPTGVGWLLCTTACMCYCIHTKDMNMGLTHSACMEKGDWTSRGML